ncbi:MAG: exo-alpha-sialidase [Bacteroidia bacterium]
MKPLSSIILGIFIIYSLVSCQGPLKLEKISEDFVYDKPPFPECHASTIEEVSPNRFMAASFGGTEEKNPDVVIWLSTTENGKWTQPMMIADGVMNDSLRYPTWNPVLFKAATGKLFLFYKVGPSPREWWGMVRSSDDNGVSWNESRRLPDGILGPIKNKPIQLADGTILAPSSTEVSTEDEPDWKAHIERSTDQGETWEKIPIDPTTEFNVIQPSILRYPNNKMQVLCRSREDAVMQAFSDDNGNTWGAFTKTTLPNPSAGTDALTLPNGWQLVVYNPTTKGRNKLNLAISKDGNTWSDALILENEEKGEYSYPAIIQAEDGKIHISYTYNRTNVKHVVLRAN